MTDASRAEENLTNRVLIEAVAERLPSVAMQMRREMNAVVIREVAHALHVDYMARHGYTMQPTPHNRLR